MCVLESVLPFQLVRLQLISRHLGVRFFEGPDPHQKAVSTVKKRRTQCAKQCRNSIDGVAAGLGFGVIFDICPSSLTVKAV